MIEEIYQHLHLLDEFSSLSRRDIDVKPLQTLPHSEVYRVRIGTPATSLILKKPGAADVAGLAARERQFYSHIAPLLPNWLVPKCVLAVDEGPLGWLFIEDLSGSRHSAANASMPSREECLGLVRALATLHALSGADSAIQTEWHSLSKSLPASTIEQRISFFSTALEPFISMVRDRVDREAVDFLSGLGEIDVLVQSGLPKKTLVHGDAHFGNALFLPDSSACLIDWGMPMLGFGEIDLAHALALNLPRDLARQWDSEIVDAYITQMAAYGSSVDVETFNDRYRLGVLYSFVSPVVWWRSGVPESAWWPGLTNLLDAARNLGLMR